MSRINCHSAFKHYEMFHSRGGDVINIGSNNTTIFNMGAGFGGGSFWSGLGYGLGNGLGSIFGGLFGGNMGGFGNFGFGGFGMSPFSNMFMTPFGGISGFNMLERSTKSKDSEDGKGKVKDSKDDKHGCDDPDRKIINDLGSKVKDTIGNKETKPADVKALYEKIKKAKTDSEKEPNHTETDKKDYENMLGTLKNYAKEKGWGDLDNDKFGINDNKPADKANANKPAAQAPATKDNPIENADNVNFDAKLKEAGDDKDKLKKLAQDTTLTPEQRAEVKAKFYEEGYSNVTADELQNEETAKALLETLKTVVDTSPSQYDFKNLKGVKAEKDTDGKWVITAESKFKGGSTAHLKYTFKETVDGELIFHGKQEKQDYVLQKKDQDVHLMQYDYHSGHGTYDVKAAEQ